MNTLQFGTTNIDYEIYSQERNDIKISVDIVNGVIVYTPNSLDESKLHMMMQKKAPWISQKIQELNEVNKKVQPKEIVSGEKLPYLGRNYRLKVNKEPVQYATIQFKQGRFIATVPRAWSQERTQNDLEQKLIAWYRQHGLKKINERAKEYQAMLGVTPRTLKLKTQHKRWGTCTPSGDIYLNWRIIMAPIRVIDYIIVHELAHLIVPEHSESFWRLVRTTLPHYKEAKEWLRLHGVELHCIG
ncbi:hypothetical protein OBCHQ24_04860 [Oceanobacillus iheyensis]|nr:hypothetical protein OBCHQ24_04860 [Oceanobacillus iheyensis]